MKSCHLSKLSGEITCVSPWSVKICEIRCVLAVCFRVLHAHSCTHKFLGAHTHTHAERDREKKYIHRIFPYFFLSSNRLKQIKDSDSYDSF